MATYKDGRPANSQIVEALTTHHYVKVLWWRHNLAKGPSFIRDLERETPRRQFLLDESDMVVVCRTADRPSRSEHGHWMEYFVVSRIVLQNAHPRCILCKGTGVATFLYSGDRHNENICSCVHGSDYWGVEHGTLKQVRLDCWEVVVIAHPRYSPGREGIREIIGSFTSFEAAETEAVKRRGEDRFRPGSEYYWGEVVVGVRVREIPLPPWA